MNAVEILERAADEMQRRGKCERLYINRNGNVCAIGAIAIALGNELSPQDFAAATIVCVSNIEPVAALRNAFAMGFDNGITKWNDSNDEPTVIAGLRAVAATLRAQEQTATKPETVPA